MSTQEISQVLCVNLRKHRLEDSAEGSGVQLVGTAFTE